MTSQILIGCMLSDMHFDWLVGNMSVCQENLSLVCITVSNSPNSPSCLDEAMETRKTFSIA